MNVYFLVEGRRTETRVYPAWLKILVPRLNRVNRYDAANEWNYFLLSGGGYPCMLQDHLRNSIEEVKASGKYRYLVVCLDADDSSAQERNAEVTARAKEYGCPEEQLQVVVQDSCIETWFLGHRKIVSPAPNTPELDKCLSFYDVRQHDPEQMQAPAGVLSRSGYHHSYFECVVRNKKLNYSKTNPRLVTEPHYLQELINRRDSTGHLPTFGAFVQFCRELSDAS